MKVIQFVRSGQERNQVLRKLKRTRCAHCRRIGTLNRHDRIQGNDPETANKKMLRGRRVWCSNRGRRGGCGRTMRIMFACVLPRHSVKAGMLSGLLEHLGAGASIKGAWERCGLPVQLQSVYHLVQRVRSGCPPYARRCFRAVHRLTRSTPTRSDRPPNTCGLPFHRKSAPWRPSSTPSRPRSWA